MKKKEEVERAARELYAKPLKGDVAVSKSKLEGLVGG